MSFAGEFRRRAFFEACRYGGDAWVFVRELLQNSRDAGARRVDIIVERRDGVDRIVCRDDGCGMSFDHAQKFLFTLYASSKSGQRDTAGRFGIGFWAVLRFDPDDVCVRSSPQGESGWQLRLSGDLEIIERSEYILGTGTEIELVRKTRGVDPAQAVWDAIQRDARHLRCRDSKGEILEVRVNSKLATAEIELDPPTFGFTRSGLRGAVALADQPQVDLLAHGLRVRTTATLDELLTRPDHRRRRSSGTPEGLVPRVILDSRRLQVLMARGDARTDRELRQLVAVGRRGIRRLVRGQLDREAGLGPMGRAIMRCRELLATGWIRKLGAGLAVAVVLVVGAWWLTEILPSQSIGLDVLNSGAGLQMRRRPGAILQVEAADRYRGPAADPLDVIPAQVTLRYQPAGAEPMLAVFRVIGMTDDGRAIPGAAGSGPRPYLGAACRESCLEFALDLGRMSGDIRLPLPTGHLLDPTSLRVEGGSVALWAAPDGGPILVVEVGPIGSIHYRTGPAVEIQPVVGGSWPDLPDSAGDLALRLRGLGVDEVAFSARDWVRQRVVYDTSNSTVDRHRAAAREGLSFVERCLRVGAGDCDVQNALLAAVLVRAGVSARMAVGFVGAEGRALPGLHAWVEYRSEAGVWRSVDASRGGPPSSIAHASPFVRRDGGPETEAESATRTRVAPSPKTGVSTASAAAMALAFGLATVGAILIARRRMVVLQIRSTDVPDLAGLLRGALARPEAYREMPALFSRRVVPSLGGSSFSLDRACALARRGRLAVSTISSELAHRAVKTGLPVIDGSRSEGEAVATTLGAIDLDRWDGIVGRGGEHPVTRRIERAAAIVGETWKVVICPELSDEVVVLDGPLAGLVTKIGEKHGPARRHRLVAVDDGGVSWQRLIQLGAVHPAAAALLLADRVAERLRMSPERKRRLLSHLAAEAVIERAEQGS